MVQALVTGSVLRWARLRAGASVEAVAEKLKVESQDVQSWEDDKDLPTFAKARDLAAYLKVPFGYLFLDGPPEEAVDIPDLRRIGDETVETLGPDFFAVYQDALAKQDWYRDYLLRQEAQPLPFVGRFNHLHPASVVAEDIRDTLEFTSEWRRTVSDWAAMFRGLVSKAEAAGIIILRNSIVGNNTHRPLSVRQFRGFALSDFLAPVVFINTADAPPAQIFSLVHELAHIWLNSSAVSNYGLDTPQTGYDPVEVFCNKVAAEVLVSRAEFERSWSDSRSLDQNAHLLSREFKVSTLVIVRRAYDLGKITRGDYLSFYQTAAAEREAAEPTPKKKGGPDFYTLARIRNSPTFARAVLNEAFEGRLLLRDAGRLLSVKPAKLRDLSKELGG